MSERSRAGEFERDPDDDPEVQRMLAAVAALRTAGLDETTLKAAKTLCQDPIQPEAAAPGTALGACGAVWTSGYAMAAMLPSSK